MDIWKLKVTTERLKIRFRIWHNALFFIICSLLFSVSACSDFLEVDVKGKATIPSFLSDPQGLNAGLVGTYNKMYLYVDNEFTKYGDVAGNMASLPAASSSGDMVAQYNFTSDESQITGAVGYIWRKIYVAQANANNIIEYGPRVAESYPAQSDYCNNIVGQALLIRAMCHFDQCRAYAQPYNYTADANHLGVPVLLRTPGANDTPSRATVREVYDAVLADLERASTLLTDAVANDRHYGSLQAVNCMFSRVYLYMEDWGNALKYARLAIGTQQLAQGDDYLGMYRDLNKQGEAIFRLSGEKMSGYLKTFYENTCVPADTLLSLFDPNDIRLKLLTNVGAKRCLKYSASVVPDNEPKRDDPFIFRLSEEYLNAVEAACMLGQYAEARPYIRAIIERAVGTEKADDIMKATSDADLLQLVRRERVKELCFEGHNFFDLTRWKQDVVREHNTTSVVKRINYPSDYFVLPLPQDELNANTNMQPNPTVNSGTAGSGKVED